MSKLTAKQRDLLYRVKTKPELQPIFFRKVKGLEWFDDFYQESFFSPDQNPRPQPAKEEGYVFIPTWPITEYLITTSSELNDPKNEKYAQKFLEIIRNCTEYAKSENYGNYRTWWKFAQIIRNIPTKFINLEDIQLISYWLEDSYDRGLVAKELGEEWLSGLLNADDTHSNELANNLLNNLYSIKFNEIKTGNYLTKEPFFQFDKHYAKEITSKVAKEAGRKLGLSAVQVFYYPLILILRELKDDKLSYIWRPAIEEHEQNHSHREVINILVMGFRDSLIGFVEGDHEQAIKYLDSLLNSEYETIKRVIIYLIGIKYGILRFLSDRIINNSFFKSNYRHEMWHFLKTSYSLLNPQLQNLVINIINNLEDEVEDEKIREKASAYRKAIWLSAIKDFNPDIERQYREKIQIAGSEPDHPDFSSYMEVGVGWGEDKSPFNTDELRLLKIDDLVDKLNKFKDHGGFRQPSLRGLTKCFKELVKTEPLSIYNHLDKFISSDLAFNYEVIEAYRELWNEKKENLPWDDIWSNLLSFCMKLVKIDDFWYKEASEQRSSFVANRHWVVGSISSLIEDGTRSDEHAFDEKLLNDAKEIILIILKKQEGEDFTRDSDAVTIAINSPRGKCIEALINLSLRYCRLSDKALNNHKEAWQEFEAIYTSELDKSNKGIYEFSTLVTNYLPNFLYMSETWVKNNLGMIFNQQNYQQWICALNGYAYVNRIYQEVYNHLKLNGDFIKALDDQNVGDKVKEKIIQNIIISYINQYENLDDQDSLIYILLKRHNYEEIRHIVWFIYSLGKSGDRKMKIKIFELWNKILLLIDFETEEGKNIASKLCNWSVFIEEINPANKELLLTIAPFAEDLYNSSVLLENIAKISDRQPFEAHEIWMKMLERSTPDFPKEAIERLLNNLTTRGSEGLRKAKEAVSIYLQRGLDEPALFLEKKIRK